MTNLRRIRARSKFITQPVLQLNLYKFQPNEYLELIPVNEKSRWSADYDAFKLKQKQDAEDRLKKEQASRKNKPLQGNLALNFLFKD